MGCRAIDSNLGEKTGAEPARTQAAVRRTAWPGWIWAVPIAALLLIGWWVIRAITKGGEAITISFDDVHGMKEGNTSLVYRGLKVGKVSDMALAKDGKTVTVTVQVEQEAVGLLRSGTRFWLRGASPSLANLSSLGAVVSGPTIVIEPGPGKPEKHFAGLAHEPAVAGSEGEPQVYGVALTGDVGGLRQGEPVTLRGFTVGEVRSIGFRYDAATGALATPVTLALYPSLFHVAQPGAPGGEKALSAAIDRLIQDGLRARLGRAPPLVGSPRITLDMAPGQSGAVPAAIDGVPQIPAQPGGSLDSIVDRVNQVPIEQIAGNVLDATRQLNTLVSSPKLGDAIAQLDATLELIHRTAGTAGPQITDLVDSLRKTADQLHRAASAADNVMGGQPSQHDMQTTMGEINEAARSVRDLADYLDRHPEALVRGRSGE